MAPMVSRTMVPSTIRSGLAARSRCICEAKSVAPRLSSSTVFSSPITPDTKMNGVSVPRARKASTRIGALTPLHLAAEAGHGLVVSKLLAAGNDLMRRGLEVEMKQKAAAA